MAIERTRAEIGRANRRRGAEIEREVAHLMGGKRNVMSGGSVLGGGDLVFPADSVFHDWLWEVKARKLVPEIIKLALEQARLESTGTLKKPAAVIRAENSKPVVVFYLEDFVPWIEALTEMGQGARIKTLVRDMRRIMDELIRATG